MNNFWDNKKVLITGHTGFKGMWLTLVLKHFGSNLTGLSKEAKGSKAYNILDSKKYFDKEYFFDISNELNKKEVEIFSKNNFDIIFHFAAQSLVSVAVKDPINTLKTNIIGTFRVIDQCLKFGTTNALVVATTDKVYLDSENLNNEKSKLGGKEFYSASKVGQENVIESFKNFENSKELNISTVRSGNVLGPGDGAPDRIMTDLINSIKKNEDIVLRNPNSIRPWQDILDSIFGYLLVAEENYKSKKSDVFNLNTEINSEVTTKEIAEKTIKEWGSKINIVQQNDKSYYEASELRLDSSKAKNLLGWESKLNIDATIKKIVAWEKSKNLNEYEKNSKIQIETYFNN